MIASVRGEVLHKGLSTAVVDVMGRCTDRTARDIQDTLPRAFSPSEVARAYGRAYETAITEYSRRSR